MFFEPKENVPADVAAEAGSSVFFEDDAKEKFPVEAPSEFLEPNEKFAPLLLVEEAVPKENGAEVVVGLVVEAVEPKEKSPEDDVDFGAVSFAGFAADVPKEKVAVVPVEVVVLTSVRLDGESLLLLLAGGVPNTAPNKGFSWTLLLLLLLLLLELVVDCNVRCSRSSSAKCFL